MSKYDNKLLTLVVILVLIVGAGLGWVIHDITSGGCYSYKLSIIYHRYGIALRDIEASTDLIKMSYYYQHLNYEDKMKWSIEKPSPSFYADDAKEQVDTMYELLINTKWPDEYKSKIKQLETYATELKELSLHMQELANKNTYTQTDVNHAEAILETFHSYNDKIYRLIKNG